MADLAARQAALVAALVSGGVVPDGFDTERLAVAAAALLRKRARGVANAWPLLAAGCADAWPATFIDWASGRTPAGVLRDGWDFARHLYASGELPQLAQLELACREALMSYDGHRPPRRRRLPAVRRVGGITVVAVLGRVFPLPRSGTSTTRPR